MGQSSKPAVAVNKDYVEYEEHDAAMAWKPGRSYRNGCQAERTLWQILSLEERSWGKDLLMLG